ncbi:SusC/RagA family TonB-linked outer membrane protein [Salegentibacter maritimus]|uniref:SusC/RagA family TonB-linked outer membrane protein n=1 Tax=Salegentibacter maritimus TaxID=2794347 RepID=UPI001E4B4F18|nr:TonB-dependent receptor [Salegentibacter maritimus]
MKNFISCKFLEFENLPKKIKPMLTSFFLIISLFKVEANSYSVKEAKIAQETITVTGRVVETGSGMPIPGANVVEKGTNHGVMTDFEGNYSIKVAEDGVLVVSFVGFARKEIPVNGRNEIDIVLETEAAALDEVVIVGYGTQKKVNLTGAVSAVDSEVFEARPITNVGQGLQGVIPNLNIDMSNGSPGSGTTFNVRGTTSINGGSPLVLVDGVEMDPNLINPNNIESVSVLKDAASASIYGARAAFGVILITTKGGEKNRKSSINYTGNFSFKKPTRMPKYMNSLDYVEMMNIAGSNSGGGVYFNDTYVNHVKEYLNNPIPVNAVFVDPNNSDKYLYAGNTDWIDALYDDYTTSQQHNFNISGGSEKTTYYASLGMVDEGGLNSFFDEDFKRYNVNLNVSTDILEWINFSAKTTYNNTEKVSPYGNIFANGENFGFISGDLRPLMPVYHPDGNFSGQGQWTNMAAVSALSGDRSRKINDVWLTGALQITPFEGLMFNFDYTTNFYSNINKIHRKEIQEHYANPDLVTLYPWTTPSSAGMDQADNYYNALNIWGQYERTVKKHYAKVMLGFNQEYTHNRWSSLSRDNLINNELGVPDQATGEKFVDYYDREWAIRGAFYRFNYIYNDKYLVELSGRYDGSSKFPKEDRFEFFPSISAGWNLSEERFMSFLKPVVNNLKLRASYGTLGNQDVAGFYPYISNLSTSAQSGYILTGEQPVAIHPAGLVSPSLTWETVKQSNFGLDYAMLNNRLNASMDYYIRRTEDMLTRGQTLPAILGTAVPNQNAADLETKGWELSLTWKDRVNDDFLYDLNFILSDNKTEITKFNNPDGILSDYYVGREIGEIWGYKSNGLFQSDQEVENAPDQSKLWGGNWSAGDVRYSDLNEDGEISPGESTLSNPGDKTIIGNTTPRYRFGFRGGLNWKSFNIAFLFQGVGKRDYMPGGNYFWGLTNEWNVPQQHSLDYWTSDNPDAYWPRPRFNHGGNFQTSNRYLQDASYIRLKNLTVGYTIPEEFSEKVYVRNLRVYISGENLWEYSEILDSYDPEVLNPSTYPLQRSLALGLDLTF